jgi:hypothetical protein
VTRLEKQAQAALFSGDVEPFKSKPSLILLPDHRLTKLIHFVRGASILLTLFVLPIG